MRVQLPEKLRFLLEPHRYKVAYGGRNGLKSWSFARALLILGANRPLRILCTREIQKSIKESVHKLLQGQAQRVGLGAFYDVQAQAIKGRNGTEFIFAGLSDLTAESIKSYEAIDIVWCEEAQAISERSWRILLPTIRKSGSEVWVSFNPELDTDPTWLRFVVNTPPDAVVVKVGYEDNPWMSAEAEAERAHDERTLPKEDYENIWLGKCRPAAAGAIYAREIAEAHEKRRIRPMPYDPTLKAHVVFDLGWNDATAIAIVQKVASQLTVVDYIEDSHRTLDSYSVELKAKALNWGKLWLPHDGFHKNQQTGKSPAEVFSALGWSVERVPDLSLENGIKNARMVFGRVYFDSDKAVRLLQCLKRYRRTVSKATNEPGSPLHDEYSHGADCFRYVCAAAEQMSNDEWGGTFVQPRHSIA